MSTTATGHTEYPAQRSVDATPGPVEPDLLSQLSTALTFLQRELADGVAGEDAAAAVGQRDDTWYTVQALLREFRDLQPSAGLRTARWLDACVALVEAIRTAE